MLDRGRDKYPIKDDCLIIELEVDGLEIVELVVERLEVVELEVDRLKVVEMDNSSVLSILHHLILNN